MAPVVPLITCDESGVYSVCEATLEWISKHDRPFGVVACAGKYRTGKSFVMNVLTNANPGFGVGHTVNRCTRGIWVCKEFFRREGEEHDVLYLDTEGIGALDAEGDTDVRIMTYTMLLCTCFLYNSVGAIDEGAISTLSFMSQMASHLRRGSEREGGGGRSGSLAAPSFVWLMRDWDLHVESKDGKAMTADEYLETALSPAVAEGRGFDPAREATRASLRDFFRTRVGRQLPRPSVNCKTMDVRTGGGINATFLNKVKDLRCDLMGKQLTPVLEYGSGGGAVSGASYADLVRAVVRSAGEHALPTMEDAWACLLDHKVSDAVEGALAHAAALPRADEDEAAPPDRRGIVDAALAELRIRLGPLVDASAEERVREGAGRLADEAVRRWEREVEAAREAALAEVDEAMRDARSGARVALERIRTAIPHVCGVPRAAEALTSWTTRLLDMMRAEEEARAAKSAAVEEEVVALRRRIDEKSEAMDDLVRTSLERAKMATDAAGGGGGGDDSSSRTPALAGRGRGEEEEEEEQEASLGTERPGAAFAAVVARETEANIRAERAATAVEEMEREVRQLEEALVSRSVLSEQTTEAVASEMGKRLKAWTADAKQAREETERCLSEKRVVEEQCASLRATLDELRQREAEIRREGQEAILRLMAERQERDDAHHEERLRVSLACARATEVLEVRNAELREAKRVRDATEELRQECKRLKTEAIVRHGELCRAESDATHKHQQICDARQEGVMLRQSLQAAQKQLDVYAHVAKMSA